ncbi:MAG: response regulator, partial [Gammaproteobacteria bacterium]|nr:response regulator [Gammaproteobacteria bacterium]
QRPRFLAVLVLCFGLGALAAWYLLRSLSTSLKRQQSTELELAESQETLHHIQKLDALGRLVGGIAHDFNNWLTVILGHAGLLRDTAEGNERLETGLDEIKQAGEQAAYLTKQLLAFSRRQQSRPRILVLDELIRDMEEMLRRVIGASITLSFSYADDPVDVELDPDQVQQVILNLINNARDAMPDGGLLSVTTESVVVGPNGIEVDGLPDGEYARLSVSDTGIGMDDETRQRVFEPFFTTKEKGHGTGLGLSVVHGIVTGSNGHIFMESREGTGSKFVIYFPRAEQHQAAVADVPKRLAPQDGLETVLVVEDNEQVRRFVETGLASLGYRVLTASGGAAGLAICKNEPAAIDVILSDVVMPETTGPMFMTSALRLRPDAVAIYMSAYTKDKILGFRRKSAEADAPLIMKPFEIQELSRLIQERLDRRRPAGIG